jgi:hypothetical protein
MARPESFDEKFRELLREIPEDSGLLEWQHLYRQVIFDMGLKLLARFPADAVGAALLPNQPRKGHDHGPGSGGQSGGPHPSIVLGLAGAALGIQPAAAYGRGRPAASRKPRRKP